MMGTLYRLNLNEQKIAQQWLTAMGMVTVIARINQDCYCITQFTISVATEQEKQDLPTVSTPAWLVDLIASQKFE